MNEQIVERLVERARKASDRFEAEFKSAGVWCVVFVAVGAVTGVMGWTSLGLMVVGGIFTVAIQAIVSALRAMPDVLAARGAEIELDKINNKE